MIVKRFKEINSTHKYLKENEYMFKDRTAIVANRQTSAIGTKGRAWFTGSDKNIAISILYRPLCEINKVEGLTVKIAEVLKEEVFKLYNVVLNVKEPNDLMLNGKKICGILTESNSIGNKFNYLIISVGFNVNEDDFPEELENIATSLKMETGKVFDKEELLKRFIDILENII